MSVAVAVILGLVQGITELFPLSSLGILVILPAVTGLAVPVTGSHYLPFLVALHLGTALALLIYFLGDWYRMIRGLIRWLAGHRNIDGRIAWLVIVATIPTGIVGFLLKTPLSHLFGYPLWAAVFLVVNGFLMLLGDAWHQRSLSHARSAVSELTAGQALRVGLFQILALIPGLSRSGSTITGGLGVGLSYRQAARFSFLLATPIILAAALVELPKLHTTSAHNMILPAVIGGVVAGVTAILSTRFLLRFFEHHRLRVFAFLSMALGVASIVLLKIVG